MGRRTLALYLSHSSIINARKGGEKLVKIFGRKKKQAEEAMAVAKSTEDEVVPEQSITEQAVASIEKDFRDADYPEIPDNKILRDAILDGKLQVVSTHNPFLVRVSDLQFTEIILGDTVLTKKKIYKVI